MIKCSCGSRVLLGMLLTLLMIIAFPFAMSAQNTVRVVGENKPQSFKGIIPAGQYSGITHIAADTFAVVSDKSEGYGFFLFRLATDKAGKIVEAENLGYRGCGSGQYDIEGIAYNAATGTVFVSSEANHRITELRLDGTATGRAATLPDSIVKHIRGNLSLESLCYDVEDSLLWTANEGTLTIDGVPSTSTNGEGQRVRLFAFDDSLRVKAWYRYDTDRPAEAKPAQNYALGVSDLASLGDGRLLVLEREARVNSNFIGSYTNIKVYVVDTRGTAIGSTLSKSLLFSFPTKLNLSRRDWGNYEGMCLVRQETDGEYVLLLVADSQGQYKGILKDWVKTLLIVDRRE
ncbi:MAG: esterase-like activity of phytase family protein [Bacteroidaceae bacterium]|nr:esterase-like activity of phytase family protein [Bacteroidaceae bacterium]